MEISIKPTVPYHLFTTVEEVVKHAQSTIPPDKILFQMADGRALSADTYLTNVARISNMFLDLGIQKNQKVGVFLSNCLDYTYLYTALGLLGVTMVPLNPFLKGDSLNYVLNHCDVEYLVSKQV